MKKNYPLGKVYSLLESGPVIMLSSAYKDRANVMTLSWHSMIDFNPPLVGCVISDQNHSFNMVKTSKECVINIPTFDIAGKAVACGNVSGARTDKFSRFGLTPQPASLVKAPLIKECYASLECRLHDSRLAGKYNLFIFRVVKAWVDGAVKEPRTVHHRGGENFFVAGRTVKIPDKMA
ncbi:MAG TPA: flavin reductase [Elusimicrobia bacterium]|nr:MAG: flavin reductase [Elusimicrobia bacterium GWA2_64_40]OGR66781.1 MAG: flavin reductase [Elusimicrobia bacterium GWB2_63_16]HAN03994.1 flavin reductase [Elusimicrobiota bacterium]HAU89277.1 flavin reductase [Elusimicrobiota bacterium]